MMSVSPEVTGARDSEPVRLGQAIGGQNVSVRHPRGSPVILHVPCGAACDDTERVQPPRQGGEVGWRRHPVADSEVIEHDARFLPAWHGRDTCGLRTRAFECVIAIARRMRRTRKNVALLRDPAMATGAGFQHGQNEPSDLWPAPSKSCQSDREWQRSPRCLEVTKKCGQCPHFWLRTGRVRNQVGHYVRSNMGMAANPGPATAAGGTGRVESFCADDYQPRSARRWGWGISSTLMPTMASPRPREALAMTSGSS